jgi:hypothetical protein
MKKLLYTMMAAFSATSLFAQLPNGGFEQWDSSTVVNGQKIYNPVNWLTNNADMAGLGQLQPTGITTDAHSGNYAVKITSGIDDQGMQAGMLVSGNTYSGAYDQSNVGEKFKLTGRIASFEGYYKYDAQESDSFRIVLAFYRKGVYFGRAYYQGGQTANYTKFNLQLINFSGPAPDSAKFIIYASYSNLSSGSKLYLDDMNVGYTTGINDINGVLPQISIYPNPANDVIKVEGISEVNVQYTIADLKGAIVATGKLPDERTLDISKLNQGMYFLQLIDETGNTAVQKFIRQE